MRKKYPDAERPFRRLGVPLVLILGIICCLVLMFSPLTANWWRLPAWLAVGFVIYFALWPLPQRHARTVLKGP